MKIVAYCYRDPLIDAPTESENWGCEVDRVYQDLMGDRIALAQLLQDCTQAPPDYLLLRRLEDLGDRLDTIEQHLHFLETHNIEILTTAEHQSPDAADFLTLLQTLRSRAIRLGHARNRINAAPPPGRVPYGYKRGRDRYRLDRSTAPVAKDFFEQFLLYGSVRGAVRYLAQKYGKKISTTTGRRWLSNPVYRGDTAYQNGDIVPDTHVAILSRDEAAQIDRLLRRNRRLPPRSASAPRSLAGLVTCAQCQSRTTIAQVSGRHKSERYHYLYVRPVTCPQRPKCKGLHYAQVFDRAIERICIELPQAVAGLAAPQLTGIKTQITHQIAQQTAILDQLPTLEAQGILDPETAQLRRYKIQTAIAELQARLAPLPPDNIKSIAQSVSLKQFWLDLSEAERRFYLREFIQAIEIEHWPTGSWDIQLRFIFAAPP
ncbi:MAG: recombinase family protein [Spirulina sp. SIO3F2]|nr:recombinase family protein [Spirulina sp. SIO3F2]